MLNGFINIDKPLELSSNKVVSEVKRLLFPIFGKVKIGHTGTLDPMASGVLPVAIGEATKTVQFQMENIKTYIFTIKFGLQTSTDDMQGDIIKTSNVIPTISEIGKVIPQFIGKIEQVPPIFSALKINGVRAYELARKNIKVEMKKRENFIHSLEIIKQESSDEVKFKVSANKGFYVRALARDLAISLGSVGCVSYLRRIANGPFDIDNSITLDKLKKILQNLPQSLDVRNFDSDFLIPVSFGLNDILAIDANEEQNKKLRSGQWLKKPDAWILKENTFYQLQSNSKLSAIVKLDNGFIKTVRVFNL